MPAPFLGAGGAEWVLSGPDADAAIWLPGAIRERFGDGRPQAPDWLAEVLGRRLFAAGGSMRAALEVQIHGGEWRPKDLDLFALDRGQAQLALESCVRSGGSVECDDDAVWRLRCHGCPHTIDLIVYELGGAADIGTALRTFDFDVNSVGWDGRRMVFPHGRREQVIEGVRTKTARVSTEHLFLRRPVRAVRRLNAMIDRGYDVPKEELERYLSNFQRQPGPETRILPHGRGREGGAG